MTSLWLDRAHDIEIDEFEAGADYDLVIAGAGLTGLTTGLLFARAGMRVAILEARHVGAAASGNTTGKLSLLQGSHLSDILRHTTVSTAKAYLDGNREGAAWLLRYCAEHGVPVQHRDAFSYASAPAGVERLEEEYEACRALGLEVTREYDIPGPFPTAGAVRLADQAQFDPMDVLTALAADFRAHGGALIESVRVLRVRPSRPARVTTTKGDVFAGRVVLATGMPFMDRGLYFMKQEALRSYALAFRVPDPDRLPQGMYLSVDAPSRSVRTAPDAGGDLLLVGGNGHPVGRHPSPLSRVDDLERWTAQYFPGAERTHSWSAQDYEPAGRIPFVGWMPRARGRVFFATGYDKWGMSNAVAASLTLAADILGGHQPWATKLHRRITTPTDAGAFIGAQAAVGVAAVTGYINAWRAPALPSSPAEGSGVVSSAGVLPVARSTVDGRTCTVSAVCPHLLGVLSWNDAELSWDCPLHGSRFSASGEVLEGPATRGLKPIT